VGTYGQLDTYMYYMRRTRGNADAAKLAKALEREENDTGDNRSRLRAEHLYNNCTRYIVYR
jgi:hypothetical protein